MYESERSLIKIHLHRRRIRRLKASLTGRIENSFRNEHKNVFEKKSYECFPCERKARVHYSRVEMCIRENRILTSVWKF